MTGYQRRAGDGGPDVSRALTRRELLHRGAIAGGVLAGSGLLAACAGLYRQTPAPSPTPLPPPETTTLRIGAVDSCDAHFWLAEGLLNDEGFTDIIYTPATEIATGGADVTSTYPNFIATAVDVGLPLVALAGLHTGCMELWASADISTIDELRGRTIDIWDQEVERAGQATVGVYYGFLLTLLTHVGIGPDEVRFVERARQLYGFGAAGRPGRDLAMKRFLSGETDAYCARGFDGPELRRHPGFRGHVILDTATDRPWSQNFCCMLAANRDWLRAHPVAAKRATRAYLRACDVVHNDKRAAVEQGAPRQPMTFAETTDLEILYETIAMLSFEWREYDAEGTMHFFAQRLRDAGLIRKSPQQIIDEGTDFSYVRQLATELAS